MCNLYSVTKGQSAIRDLFTVKHDRAGNLPPLPAIFPDQMAPVIRVGPDGERELVMARWRRPARFCGHSSGIPLWLREPPVGGSQSRRSCLKSEHGGDCRTTSAVSGIAKERKAREHHHPGRGLRHRHPEDEGVIQRRQRLGDVL